MNWPCIGHPDLLIQVKSFISVFLVYPNFIQLSSPKASVKNLSAQCNTYHLLWNICNI